VALAAVAHPQALKRVESWGLLPSGQLEMFSTSETSIITITYPAGLVS
jgi:hypothetical protein